MKSLYFFFSLTLIVMSGCSSLNGTKSSKLNLSGNWNFEVPVSENTVTHGSMTLVAEDDSYRGTLTTNQGEEVLPLRLLLDGFDIKMTVESPQGEVVFEGTLDPSGNSFAGKVTYHTGGVYSMTGKKAS
jgi:hypothetical protein